MTSEPSWHSSLQEPRWLFVMDLFTFSFPLCRRCLCSVGSSQDATAVAVSAVAVIVAVESVNRNPRKVKSRNTMSPLKTWRRSYSQMKGVRLGLSRPPSNETPPSVSNGWDTGGSCMAETTTCQEALEKGPPCGTFALFKTLTSWNWSDAVPL